LRAVTSQRRGEKIVLDHIGQRRSECGDGRREHNARAVLTSALFVFPDHRIEYLTRAVQIDAVALLEIGLRFAGHNGGQVKDDIGFFPGPCVGRAGRR